MWHVLVLGASLIVFSVYTYEWVSSDIYKNLNNSLLNAAKAIDQIVGEGERSEKLSSSGESGMGFELFKTEEKRRFVGPLRPGRAKENAKPDLVWTAIYSRLLLNPQNYYIQLSRKTGEIVWRSRNLGNLDLPVFSETASLDKKKKEPSYKFDGVLIRGRKFRVLEYYGKNAAITIAYPMEEIDATLKKMFGVFAIALPVLLAFIAIGSALILKSSLKPIDEIITAAREISGKNLKLRLPRRDIDDELARLTNALNDMIERLEIAFDKAKQFTSDASHELRTPLTILRGELEIALKRERTPEEYQEVLNSALEEILRLSNLTESLLELSRGDQNASAMKFFETNVSDIVKDIAEDMEIVASAKGIEISSEIEEGVYCLCDSERIYQAIMNVVDNAVKYTAEGGKISIKFKDRNEYVELSVADTGVGMTKEELSRIFDRFYRADKSRGEFGKGAGLGLSIVKWIVNAHNGKIVVESQAKVGTKFIIMLPKDPTNSEKENAKKSI